MKNKKDQRIMSWGDLLAVIKQYEESITGTYIIEDCPTYWVDAVCGLAEKKFPGCVCEKKKLKEGYEILVPGISQETADKIRTYVHGIIDSFNFLDSE